MSIETKLAIKSLIARLDMIIDSDDVNNEGNFTHHYLVQPKSGIESHILIYTVSETEVVSIGLEWLDLDTDEYLEVHVFYPGDITDVNKQEIQQELATLSSVANLLETIISYYSRVDKMHGVWKEVQKALEEFKYDTPYYTFHEDQPNDRDEVTIEFRSNTSIGGPRADGKGTFFNLTLPISLYNTLSVYRISN
jgi:hypothetical protein